MHSTLRRSRLLFAIFAGSVAGVLTLGAGGRLAMYAFALATDRPPVWTFEGTLTVLFFGLWIGAAGALLRCAAACWLPERWPEWPRTALFAAACLTLGLRGVSPFTGTTLALFLPVIGAYILTVELLWRRVRPGQAGARSSGGAEAEHGRQAANARRYPTSTDWSHHDSSP